MTKILLILATLFSLVLFTETTFAAATTLNILRLDTSATNVPTSSFVQLSASTPINTRKLVIVNTTASVIFLGTGVASSEIGLVAIPPSSAITVDLGFTLVSGTRLSLEAQSVAASTGFVTVSLMQ